MTECDRLASCIFFNDRMLNAPAAAALLKQQYCQGHYESCARRRVEAMVGSTSVPPDLFPEDVSRADRIIAES